LVNADTFRRLMGARLQSLSSSRPPRKGRPAGRQPQGRPGRSGGQPAHPLDVALLEEVEQKAVRLLHEIGRFTGGDGDAAAIGREVRQELEVVLQLPVLESLSPPVRPPKFEAMVEDLNARLDADPAVWGSGLSWLFVHSLGRILGETDYEHQSRSWIDEWLLNKIIAAALLDLGLDEAATWQAVTLVKLLTTHQRWYVFQSPPKRRAYSVLESWLQDADVQQYLQVNRYQNVLWYNKEAFEQLAWWMLWLAVTRIAAGPGGLTGEAVEEMLVSYDVVEQLLDAGRQSQYQVEKLLAVLEG
jgi:hypothetical protein